jgi:transposase
VKTRGRIEEDVVCSKPDKGCHPLMKKRSYRKISINQFQPETVMKLIPKGRLVFAIDVAKVDMVAAFADERGQAVAFITWKNPSENGQVLAALAQVRGEGYQVEAVMESSGTYGDVLRHQLIEAAVPVFRVGGKRTHDAREIYDGVPSLHDAKCAAIIAKLHAEGISALWPAATAEKRNLRAAVELMDLYQERYLQLVHRLESWLARHWPELPEILELTSATLLALLGRIGGPAQVAAAPEQARRLMRGMSHQLMDPAKIERVIEGAPRSAGVPMLDLERETLMAIADEAQKSFRAFTSAKTSLEKLAMQTHAQKMASTVGKATAAVFATFVGDPSLFASSAAYVKAFGLNLREKSSGKFQGHLKITKRGSGRARQYLWLAVCRWVQKDPIARAWYDRKVGRDAGRRAKAIVALMRKLAGALYHIGRGDQYDAAKLFAVKKVEIAAG